MKNNFNDKVNNFFKTYQDRGMKKWQGMMLSDHNAALSRDAEERATVYEKKETMDQEAISEVLLQAYANNTLVRVQLKEVDDDGSVLSDISGIVKGYNGDKIIVGDEAIELDSINHIEVE